MHVYIYMYIFKQLHISTQALSASSLTSSLPLLLLVVFFLLSSSSCSSLKASTEQKADLVQYHKQSTKLILKLSSWSRDD
jgi:hypothetical protein